jgi:hypothetical protein
MPQLNCNKFQYYVDNGKGYICSAYSAKKRYINWWLNQASAQKDQYIQYIPAQGRIK